MVATPLRTEVREERALERGRTLAPRVERVGRGVYAVPSQSQAGELHLVSDLTILGVGEGLACDCPGWEFRQVCAHTAAVVVRRQQLERAKLSVRPHFGGRRGGG